MRSSCVYVDVDAQTIRSLEAEDIFWYVVIFDAIRLRSKIWNTNANFLRFRRSESQLMSTESYLSTLSAVSVKLAVLTDMIYALATLLKASTLYF